MNALLLFISLNLLTPAVPAINKKVIEYVNTVIGKKVARGECWDLAAAALEYAGAYLDRSNQKNIYVFGKELNPNQDNIYPGDIIQIEDVKMEYTKGNMIYTETMRHHTAIIYEIVEKNVFKIAHQNTSFSGKKVGISNFDLNTVQQGTVIFYRPYKR
ncbi:MAG: hypothetical protein MI975_11220 [Cytophagales bacterium]|nr:hypothetical protein [Cytophagales bacterium]